MKKILILINSLGGLYNFRRELLEELLKQKNKVIIFAPPDEKSSYFKNIGCEYIEVNINRRGTNIFQDGKLLLQYLKVIKKISPDIILTYTIKPNIYGGIAARINNKKIIHTVTGLGTVYIQNIWQKNIIVQLNKFAFSSASKILFLNKDNFEVYNKLGIVNDMHLIEVVPGSGVNLETFKYNELQVDNKTIFTFIGRVFKDKGIEEYLEAAKNIKQKYHNIIFQVVGMAEELKYKDLLREYEEANIITYLGKRDDIPDVMKLSTCIVLPSYGEGRGTVLQEGAAIGRPLITCDTYGCRDNIKEGYNGLLCKVADAKSLQDTMEEFIHLSDNQKIEMGSNSRKLAEEEFDRNLVIKKYIDSINKILNNER